MSESISVSTSTSQPIGGRRTLLFVAWAIVLLTTVPEIILRAFMQLDTSWMLPARIGLLAVLFAVTQCPTPAIRRASAARNRFAC